MSSAWVAGLRSGKLYTAKIRPLDPRWSQRDLQRMLAWSATGQHLGWSEERAFQAAEGLVMKSLYHGIRWPNCTQLVDDMDLLISREQHESQ